ncbi:hypothetical protein M0R45_017926 [Rubus argutus]|uniref:Uncharacterized protein n=1 Tax=Rubus argutus TaxID=59490 RepID=A0AAW1XZ30_RUBAR
MMTEGGDETMTKGGLDGLVGIGFNNDKIGDVRLDGLTEIGVEGSCSEELGARISNGEEESTFCGMEAYGCASIWLFWVKSGLGRDGFGPGVRKRRTRERRGGRRSRTTISNSKNVESKTKLEHGGNELSSHDGLEVVKTEKKEEVKKRQGAASFLRRMKQNGRGGVGWANNSSDVSEDESKDSMVEEEEGEEEEVDDMKKKKAGRKKAEVERKVRVTRSSSGNRGRRGGRVQESGGRAKRGVVACRETAAAGSGKRGKDNGEADQVGSAGRPRKRTRR